MSGRLVLTTLPETSQPPARSRSRSALTSRRQRLPSPPRRTGKFSRPRPFTVTGTATDPGSPTQRAERGGSAHERRRLADGKWDDELESQCHVVAVQQHHRSSQSRQGGQLLYYRFNVCHLHPPNTPPNTPSNVSPPNGAANVSVTPTLQASAFSDPDCVGDTHAASQWQVLNSAGVVIVADSGTDTVNKVSWLSRPTNCITAATINGRCDTGTAGMDGAAIRRKPTFTNGGPLLSETKQGTNMVFKWSTNALGFTLQWSTNLGTAIWSNATPAPVIVGGQYTVTNSMTNKARFYRLKK